MKTVARILMGLAAAALLGLLAAAVYALSHYGVTTKTVLAVFVALLAFGGLIGRMVVVARDSFPHK